MCPLYRKWSACPGHSERLWGSGGPWCTRAGVSGYEKHCETFTYTHRESFPTCACGWVGSHSHVCCAWSVYFIAISPRGEFVLGIDRCPSWEINSTLFSTPKPLLTNFSEYTPSLPGQGIHQPWHKWLVEMVLYPCSQLRRDVRGEPGGRCSHCSLAALGGLVRGSVPTPYNCGGIQPSLSFYIHPLMSCHRPLLPISFPCHAVVGLSSPKKTKQKEGRQPGSEWNHCHSFLMSKQTQKPFYFSLLRITTGKWKHEQKSLLATAGGFMVLKRYSMWLKWNHS